MIGLKFKIGRILGAVFTFCLVQLYASAAQDLSRYEASRLFDVLDQQNNYTESLFAVDINELPVGISRTVSNINYTIAVSNIRLHDEYAELTVWGRIIVPQSNEGNKVLFFGAQGIKLSNEGDIIGDAFLMLLADVVLPINGGAGMLTLKGGFDAKTGTGEKLTYMAIDCQGYKELGLTADLTLSDALVRKVDEQGRVNGGDSKVTSSFSTVVKDWNDIILSLSLPRFEIVGLNDFMFEARRAVFDFSDTRNSDAVKYPQGYQEQYIIPGNANLWKGIYIEELNITLPKQFVSREDTNGRISFITHHMLFDHNGISGLFNAENVLTFENGSAGGWPFSVERFSIELMANHLQGAGFGGRIALPIAQRTPLQYEAYISPDNEYLLKVAPDGPMEFDVWAAQVKLLPNSYVELKVKEGRFLPSAMLSGSMTISAGNVSGNSGGQAGSIAELKGVKFQELRLTTEAPYLSVKYLGYEGEAALKQFPLSIHSIALKTVGNHANLEFNAKIGLGEKPFALAADTHFEVVGKMDKRKGVLGWTYEKVEIPAIQLKASIAEVMSLSGGIHIMDDDPVYGDGFAGNITVTIEKGISLTVKSRMIFGKTTFRYWMADGSAVFGGNGIPIVGPLNLNGFGGGVYYRMAQQGMGDPASPTGTVYVPDETRGLGLKAAVMLNIGKPEAINGEVSFEIAFNRSGGLAYLGFFGQVKVLGSLPGMDKIGTAVAQKFDAIAKAETAYLEAHAGVDKGLDKLQKYKLYEPTKAAAELFPASEQPGQSGFLAAMGIQYDFNKNTLHSTFDLYVNMAGGMLRGIGQNNRAGYSVLHIEPGEWYMHMGTPTNPLGVELNLAGLIKARTGAYFMTGSRLEPSPPPPAQVANILGVELNKLDYMRELNTLEGGKGFAFGTNFSIETGDMAFLILYANFQAGLGFDIMLKDYGNTYCKGRTGPVGMDGWYANGQAYAYLQGEAGVNVKLLFVRKKIPVIKAGAATLFQAQLPNPAWLVGYLGVKFEVLGGLVKGNVRLKMEFGEKCEVEKDPGGSPLDFPVISDMKPDDQTTDVDVFSVPQVTFTMPIGKSFEMEDDKGPALYRLALDKFTVKENGKEIKGTVKWNISKDAASFYSHEIFSPKVKLTATVQINFETYRNGRWEVVYTGGQKAQEQKEISFTTGTAPDNIPLHNIDYCYPVASQQYFLAGETNKGYIQLKRGQSYLFTNEYTHEIYFVSADGMLKIPFQYNSGQNRLMYSMPQTNAETRYTLSVVSLAKGKNQYTANVVSERQIGSGENEISIREVKAENIQRSDEGKVLLEYTFATSKYRTFAEKMRGMILGSSGGWRKDYYVYLLYSLQESEPFDGADLLGNEFSGNKPLIVPEATLEDDFYKKQIHPLLYTYYPFPEGISIANRDVNQYGVPPSRALFVADAYLAKFAQGETSAGINQFPYTYNLYEVYGSDFYEIRSKLVNKYLGTNRLKSCQNIITGSFPAFEKGIYQTIIRYYQPDGTPGTSSLFNFEKTF